MAKSGVIHMFILISILFCAAMLVRGSRVQISLGNHRITSSHQHTSSEIRQFMQNAKENWKRMKIGSVAPTCTYNECRGCKHKCSAEQVPVEGNDPINSPYHYRCVCHR